ncbi:MAG: nitroreductase family protein [Thermomicrobiaceae bacterium]
MTATLFSTNPWLTDESKFPHAASQRDQLSFCVNYAVLAPSIHNTQPWLFRLLDDAIELYADRTRMLPETDPLGRELTISCGAALANLLVAVRWFGYEGWVQYMPDRNTPDLLARVRIGRSRRPGYQDETTFRSITRRRSVRKSFQTRPVPRELQRRLIWLVSEYGCWLHLAESERDRSRVSGLVESAQQQLLDNAPYQAERNAWICTGERATVAAGSNASDKIDSLAGKRWLERDRELIATSPALLILGTDDDSPLSWLHAGEALQHMLLRSESEGVSASFLNQPCQIPHYREELRALTGRNGPPQTILRMGYSSGNDPVPRRPVQDVMIP